MGPQSKGQATNRMKLSLKKGEKPLLLVRMAGEGDWNSWDSFAGYLKSIDLYYNQGNTQHDIPPSWKYRFVFLVEGAQEEKYDGEYTLELGKHHRFSSVFLNTIAGAEFAISSPVFQFCVYLNKDDKPRIHFYERGDMKSSMNWKYRIPDDVPKAIETGNLDDFGNPVYDFGPVNEFWDNVFINEVYPKVMGKPYVASRDARLCQRMIQNSREKMFPNISDQNFLESWKKVCNWMKEKLPHPEDQAEVLLVWKDKASQLKIQGVLDLSGTIKEASDPVENTVTAGSNGADDDDLPF